MPDIVQSSCISESASPLDHLHIDLGRLTDLEYKSHEAVRRHRRTGVRRNSVMFGSPGVPACRSYQIGSPHLGGCFRVQEAT